VGSDALSGEVAVVRGERIVDLGVLCERAA